MTEAQRRALNLKQEIEEACIRNDLNMTIYDGMIGFVDQSNENSDGLESGIWRKR